MSDHKFDRLLSDIRNEKVDDRVVSQAGDRVWSSITGPSAAELSTHMLRSCEDFQTLVPAYLDKSLPEARRLLFEDHVHQCVACRHAVEQARSGDLTRQSVRHDSRLGALCCKRRPSRDGFRRGDGP